ncbi:hypothetical protein AKG34_21455, partial [Peribacillus butanolivorans]|uniref:MobA/MobL family protein n=1 Tax=Peribacillus butanolivorans TaxID=421767 RepID=UPI0006C63013
MKQEKILHFGTTIVTNSSHRSVPSRFAYSVGIKIKDEKTNKTYYSQKKSKEDGIETEMILNSAASEKFKNTNYFFNKINNEKRADGRVFYEFNVTLYQGLTKEENKNVARDFAQQFSEKYETPTSVSFHKMDSDNPHFHIIFSERTVSGEELSKKKSEKMRGQNFIPTSRKLFSDVSNEHFNKLGKEFFVDHRSYKDRGLEKQPLRRVNKKSKIQDIDLIKLENKIIKIENKEIEYKQKYKEIKSEHYKKSIETKHKLEKAVAAKTQGKEVKNVEVAKIQTVHKLYNKEIKKQEDKFLTKRKEHKEQKQQNV